MTAEGYFKPFPPTGARTLNSRTAFYYGYTLDSPGMIMRLPNVGSQYLMGFMDADKNPFDGGKTYRVTLPKDIPAAAFWSFTLYDNQTRSMLQTPQRYPRAGSQTYPSPAAVADADGSTTIYFGPTKPADAKDGNWIQTMPGKGWFTILRLYSPREIVLHQGLAADAKSHWSAEATPIHDHTVEWLRLGRGNGRDAFLGNVRTWPDSEATEHVNEFRLLGYCSRAGG